MDNIRRVQNILNKTSATDETSHKKIEKILEKLTKNALSQYINPKPVEQTVSSVKLLNLILVITIRKDNNSESKIIVYLTNGENFCLNKKFNSDWSTSLCFSNIDGKLYVEETDEDELESFLFVVVNEQNVLNDDVYIINQDRIQIINDENRGLLFKLNSNGPSLLESWVKDYQGVSFTKFNKLWMIKYQNNEDHKEVLKQHLKRNEKHYLSSKTKLQWNQKIFKIFYYLQSS